MFERGIDMDFMNNLNSMIAGESREVRERRQLIDQKEKTRQNLIASVDADINSKNFEINFVYQKIGKAVYEQSKEEGADSIALGSLSGELGELKSKFEELEVLNAKRAEIDARYSEELEMLKKLLPQVENGSAGINVAVATCTNCGAIKKQGALFCTSCGQKFE